MPFEMISLKLKLYAFLIVKCTCEFFFNGGSFWTEITYLPDQLFRGISYFVTTTGKAL